MSEELPRIRFAHNYSKLKDGFSATKRAKLLEVLEVRLEALSRELIEYDTRYGFGNYCKLPAKGDYLLLIFEKSPFWGEIFTTLRRSKPQKLEYYRGLIGQVFEVEVEVENQPVYYAEEVEE